MAKTTKTETKDETPLGAVSKTHLPCTRTDAYTNHWGPGQYKLRNEIADILSYITNTAKSSINIQAHSTMHYQSLGSIEGISQHLSLH
jgi:hypothetical protein